jgi:hypothetical protein
MRYRAATVTALIALAMCVSAPGFAQPAPAPKPSQTGPGAPGAKPTPDLSACIVHTNFVARDGSTGQRWVNHCGVMIQALVFRNGRQVQQQRMFVSDPDHNPLVANTGDIATFTVIE